MNESDPGKTPKEFHEFCLSCDGSILSLYANELLRHGVSSGSFNRPDIIEALERAGIPSIAAGDIVAEYRAKFRKSKNIGIFWDYENVLPNRDQSGVEIMQMLRGRMTMFAEVMQVHVYVPRYLNEKALELPGAVVHLVPSGKRKEVADKMIIVDAIGYAFDTEDAIVCIISGDSDFSALISKLQMLGTRTIAVTQDNSSVRSMRSVSMLNLSWPSDFVGSDAAAVGWSNFAAGSGNGGGGGSRPVSPQLGQQQQQRQQGSRGRRDKSVSPGKQRRSGFSVTHAKSPTAGPPTRDAWGPQLGGNNENDDDNNNKGPSSSSSTNRTPPRRPQHLEVSANFGGGDSSTTQPPSLTPLFRRNSMLPTTQARSSFCDEDVNNAETKTEFLVSILQKLKSELGYRKFQRHQVAQVVRNTLGNVSFKALVNVALQEGAIEIGSSGGQDWIGLPKDRKQSVTNNNNRDDNASVTSSEESSVAQHLGVNLGAATDASDTSSSSSSMGPRNGPRDTTKEFSSPSSLAAAPPKKPVTAVPSPDNSASSLIAGAISKNNTNNASSSSSSRLDVPHPRSETLNSPATPSITAPASPNGPIYVSYRLMKNKPGTNTMLSLRQSDFDAYHIEIVDTPDTKDPERFVRRAFGPFPNEAVAEQFTDSLKRTCLAIPMTIRYRPSAKLLE